MSDVYLVLERGGPEAADDGPAVAAFLSRALADEFCRRDTRKVVHPVQLLDALPEQVRLWQAYGVHHSSAHRVDTPEVWEVTRTTTRMIREQTAWDFDVKYHEHHGWHRTLEAAVADYEQNPRTRWEA